MSRGISEEEATEMIVGFIEPFTKELQWNTQKNEPFN